MRRAPGPSALHALHVGRIAVAALVVGAFTVSAFLQAAVFVAVHDALAWLQVFPSLWRLILAGFSSLSFGFLAVAALTVAFGRVYCSTLCPLGVVQDGLFWIARRVGGPPGRRSLEYRPPLELLRYVVLGVTVVLLAAGVPALIDLLEPYSFFGRVLRNLAGPALAYPLSRALSAALEGVGVYVQPLTWAVQLGALVATAASFVLLAVLTILRGRLYCNSLCPVGTVLGLVSRRSRWGVIVDGAKCTRCGRCTTVCPAQCIDLEAGRVDGSRCLSCFRCLSACTFGATRWGRRARRSGATKRAGAGLAASRRAFLRAAAGVGAGVGLAVFAARQAEHRAASLGSSLIVPPGALSVSRFLSTCTACHLCVRRCPTHVLQPTALAAGPRGLFQPRMDYRSGSCDFQCNVCSQVCPSGALLPLALPEKQETRIGAAELVLADCIVVTNGTACGACAEICPTGAAHMVPYRNGLTVPALRPETCIGCGSCEFVCPAVPRRAITVKSVSPHARISLAGATRVEQEEPGESEGGFAF